MTKHENNGECERCLELLNVYPGFDLDLLGWFKMVQAKFFNFHISEGGRGRVEQESDFQRGASKAHFGESAHNYNCAFDTFFLVNGQYSLDEKLYAALQAEIPEFVNWYGSKGAVFYERPHFEKRNWKDLRIAGLIALVE